MFAGWKKGKRNRCPGYTTASRLMNTKPLYLSHLEIDRWKLLRYISFFVNISFYFSAYFPIAGFFFVLRPTPTPLTFLMVHLTLRAGPPNLLSDAKWSSGKRMNSSAAERVHGPSLSFIQWRIQGRGPRGPSYPLFLDQTETRRAENFFFWRPAPPPLSKGLDNLDPSLSQGLDPALLFTTQTLTLRRLCCHSSQSWQGRGRGA